MKIAFAGRVMNTSKVLAGLVVGVMLAANISMIPGFLANLPCLPRCFLTNLPADIQANVIFLACTVVVALLLDAKSFVRMFVHLHDEKTGLQGWGSHFGRLLVVANWAAGSGVACSTLKLSVTTPLKDYTYAAGDVNLQILHDLVVGELQLNPLVRANPSQYWESAYGLMCAAYLVLFFGLSASRTTNFSALRFFTGKGSIHAAIILVAMAFSGLFGRAVWHVAVLLIAAHLGLFCLSCHIILQYEISKGGRGKSIRAATELWCMLRAVTLLFASNVLLGIHLTTIHFMGKNSLFSWLLVYGPVTLYTILLICDRSSWMMIVSILLAMMHGIAHVVYPFLDEIDGVVKTVDVWQDQILHAGQAVLFVAMWYKKTPAFLKILFIAFLIGNVCNVTLGYFCWGQPCHELYVQVALIPSLASGLHFAMGSLHKCSEKVAAYGFLLQGLSSCTTYFLFKKSDDFLKWSAGGRFFELYFIVPHLVGFVYGRLVIQGQVAPENGVRLPMLRRISDAVGMDLSPCHLQAPRTPEYQKHLKSYFDLPAKGV